MIYRIVPVSILLALSVLMGQETGKVEFDPVTGAPITTEKPVQYDPVTGLPVVNETAPPATPAFDPTTGAPLSGAAPTSVERVDWTGLTNAQIIRLGNRNAKLDHNPYTWTLGGGMVSLAGLAVGSAAGGMIMGEGAGTLIGMGVVTYTATDAVAKVRRSVRVPFELSAAPFEKRELYRQEYRDATRKLRFKSSLWGIPVIMGGFMLLGLAMIGF